MESNDSTLSEIKQYISITLANGEKDESYEQLCINCYKTMQNKPQEFPIEDSKTCLSKIEHFYLMENKNIAYAQDKWVAWCYWLTKYHPETITEKDIPNEIATGKAFVHGYDKEGRSCIVLRQALHDPYKSEVEEMVKLGMFLMEKALKCSKHPNKEIVVLFDRINFGWSNFDRRLSGKAGLLGMFQDYYADKVYKMYIYPVNWLFQTLQKIVKPFLSKMTQEKVVLCYYEEELMAFYTKENLIKEVGGTSDFEYVYPDKIDFI